MFPEKENPSASISTLKVWGCGCWDSLRGWPGGIYHLIIRELVQRNRKSFSSSSSKNELEKVNSGWGGTRVLFMFDLGLRIDRLGSVQPRTVLLRVSRDWSLVFVSREQKGSSRSIPVFAAFKRATHNLPLWDGDSPPPPFRGISSFLFF